uniref:uncharacterized protein CFAP92 isoform X1 n=2 Tax=Myxine glutinosa TaxID=7769 RepID=UPI00358F3C89
MENSTEEDLCTKNEPSPESEDVGIIEEDGQDASQPISADLLNNKEDDGIKEKEEEGDQRDAGEKEQENEEEDTEEDDDVLNKIDLRSNKVTFFISFAIALTREADIPTPMGHSKGSNAYGSQNFISRALQFELVLLPNQAQPFKFDVTTTDGTAKITAGSDIKVINTWEDGICTWLAWTQSYTLEVDLSSVILLPQHKLTLHMWESRYQPSQREKNDKKKPGKAVKAADKEIPELEKELVHKLQLTWTHLEVESPSRHQSQFVETESHIWSQRDTDVQEKQDGHQLGDQLGDPINHVDGPAEPSVQDCGGSESDRKNSQRGSCTEEGQAIGSNNGGTATRHNSQSAKDKGAKGKGKAKAKGSGSEEQPQSQKDVARNDVVMHVPMACLLGGAQEVIGRLEQPCEGLHDIMCHVEAEGPIIPEDVRIKLNPLLIHIIKAKNLPNCPVTFKTLQEKCQPVYCEIQAPGFNVHRTRGHRHGEDIYFNDTCIFLLGTISHASLLQLLQGPPLKIFLHDRRTNPQGIPQGLGNLGDEAVVYRPSGVAHLDLSDLLSAQRCMRLNLPITVNKQSPDLDSRTLEPHFPPGHYLVSGAHLKVTVSTLLSHSALAYPQPLPSCPYRRVVFLSQAGSKELATVHSKAVAKNRAALGLYGNANLGTYDQLENEKNLDILTGFHVSDKNSHVLMLEGLYNGVLQELCQTFQQAEDCSILYNWMLAFDHRLYSKLHLDFRPLHLLIPLSHLLRRPSLYIRSSNVPSLVREALSRLDHLHRSWTLRSVIQNDLLPTAEMILCLEQEVDGLLGPTSKPSRSVRTSDVRDHQGTNAQNQNHDDEAHPSVNMHDKMNAM